MNITSKQLRQLKAGKHTYAKEGDLVKDCIRWLAIMGCFVWKQNQGGMKTDTHFIRFAHVDGVSDIIGMTPLAGSSRWSVSNRRRSQPQNSRRSLTK